MTRKLATPSAGIVFIGIALLASAAGPEGARTRDRHRAPVAARTPDPLLVGELSVRPTRAGLDIGLRDVRAPTAGRYLVFAWDASGHSVLSGREDVPADRLHVDGAEGAVVLRAVPVATYARAEGIHACEPDPWSACPNPLPPPCPPIIPNCSVESVSLRLTGMSTPAPEGSVPIRVGDVVILQTDDSWVFTAHDPARPHLLSMASRRGRQVGGGAERRRAGGGVEVPRGGVEAFALYELTPVFTYERGEGLRVCGPRDACPVPLPPPCPLGGPACAPFRWLEHGAW